MIPNKASAITAPKVQVRYSFRRSKRDPFMHSTIGQASGEVKGSGVPPFLMGIG